MGHLAEQNETYCQHFKCAIKFAGILFALALISAIHALIPCVFVSTTSTRLETLIREIKREKTQKSTKNT